MRGTRLISVVFVTSALLATLVPSVVEAAAQCRHFGEPHITSHIVGTPGDDVLTGTEGDDVICGLGGNDVIDGRGGNDILEGGPGNDTLRGSVGSDTVSYFNISVPVSVNLMYFGTHGAASGEGTDVIYDVENIRGGGGEDRLTGDNGPNVIRGEAGTDVIQGRGGNDFLYGLHGHNILRGDDGDDVLASDGTGCNQRLEGGNGRDSVSFGGRNDPMNVNLGYYGRYGPGVAQSYPACRDILVSVENVNGSRNADRIVGDARPNRLHGGAGNDVLQGMDGDDLLSGSTGDDTLRGGPNDDGLAGGGGNDVCDQGTGTGPQAGCERT